MKQLSLIRLQRSAAESLSRLLIILCIYWHADISSFLCTAVSADNLGKCQAGADLSAWQYAIQARSSVS